MAEFAVSVERWTKKAGDNALKVFTGVALELLNRVKEYTPVDTGWLRANWQDRLNSPDAAPEPRPADSRAGQFTSYQPSMLYAAIASAQLGDVIYIVNGVPYAPYVEYGTSKMEARGMMRRAVKEFTQIANEVTRKVTGANP